jgi:hypothetical protein
LKICGHVIPLTARPVRMRMHQVRTR